MLKFALWRLVELVPVLVGVSILVFFFIHLIPGDPAVVMAGDIATPKDIAAIRTRLGLDQPLDVQYLKYMAHLFHGDLGQSIQTNSPIAAELGDRLPASLELALTAMGIAVVVGLAAGVVSAMRPGSAVDTASMVGALVGVSMPIYVLGLIAIWFFAVQLKWLPPGGRLGTDTVLVKVTGLFVLDSVVAGNWRGLGDAVAHLAIPACALSTVPMAIIARITRSSLLDVMAQDFIRTAYGKGLAGRAVVVRHALKNAMLPVVTVLGMQFGVILSGAVLTETIFAWPGIGRWVYEAIQTRDYPVVQGMTLFIGLVFIATNFLVDILYAWLDPRIQYQ
ncbi:MAG TPA: ABC transporter permease [bacterium]|nr:ABC transporter permease [bacterium]